MSQTERTIAQVQSILANNATKDISPEDIRDALATALGGYAGLLLTIAASPVIKATLSTIPLIISEYNLVTAQSVDENINGTGANVGTGIITTNQSGIYRLGFHASYSLDTSNKEVSFQLFKNAAVDQVGIKQFILTTPRKALVCFETIVLANAGDDWDIRTFIDSGSVDMEFTSLAFTCHRIG